MRRTLLSSLVIIAALAVFVPTPSPAAINGCSSSCSGGSCSCSGSGCSCSCNGGDPKCTSSSLTVHVVQNTLAVIRPFEGEDNDTDLSSVKIARAATYGEVSYREDGTFLYMPANDFTGLDSFTFSSCNFAGECGLETVLVDVVPEASSAN
jgi:Bacterial Ig domain